MMLANTLPIVILCGVMFGQTTTRLASNDPRALAKAVEQLEQALHVPVNYEDVRYEYGGDMVDVTDAVQRPEQKAAHPNGHILVPRGGSLDSEVQIGATGNAAEGLAALTTLTAAHKVAGYPGTYTVEYANKMFYITPSQVRNAAGASVSVKSIFDTKVRFPVEDRSGGDTLQLIVTQVENASGFHVGVGMVPLAGMIRSKVLVGAYDEPARDVIARLLGGIVASGSAVPSSSVGMAYHLYFEPRLRYYMFNVHPVDLVSTKVAPTPQAAKTDVPEDNSGKSQFFTRLRPD